MRRNFYFIVKAGFTAVLLLFVFSKIDFSTFHSYLKTVSTFMLLLALILMFLQCLLGAFKWHLILRFVGIQQSFGIPLRVFWVGMFFNSFFPAGIAGDSVRVWMVQRLGHSLSKVVDSVLLDRLIGLFVMVLASLISIFVLKKVVTNAFLIHLFELFTLLGLIGFSVLSFLHRLPVKWTHFRILRAMYQLSLDTYMLCTSPAKTGLISVVAFISISWQVLLVYVLAQAFHFQISFLHCWVFVPPVVLLTTLPISVGGWGIREGAMVTLSGMVGVSSSAALSLSILLGLITVLISLPGGIVWMLWRNHTAAEMVQTIAST